MGTGPRNRTGLNNSESTVQGLGNAPAIALETHKKPGIMQHMHDWIAIL